MYCVYITTYNGDILPRFYVGSSSIKKVNNGYRGSVSSIKWKNIWKSELIENPNLFTTEIISVHSTRKEALDAELLFQIDANVVSSEQWINMSFARTNGFFGMDVSGENNPMYGSIRKGEIHNGGKNIAKSLRKFFDSDQSDNHRKCSSDRMKSNNPTTNSEILIKIKNIWKTTNRNVGKKNGMYGKPGRLLGKVLYNDDNVTRAFFPGQQPEGWKRGRKKV